MEYTVKPIIILPVDEVLAYWQKLVDKDFLKKRICNKVNPTIVDVADMIRKMTPHIFAVLRDDEMVGEFTLENFTGKAAQIHFSVNPDLSFKETIEITKWTINDIIEKNDGINCLYGFTPLNNREVCVFVLKVGFKKMGILPEGMYSRGELVDAMITTFTRE